MDFINIIGNNPFLIYAFAFFGMLISNLFPIMFFLFPEIIITSVIYLSGERKVSIYMIFVFCLVGAIIGETMSYFIGKHIKKEKLYKYFKQENIEKIEAIFHTHHKKSIIIGKMLPGITWLVPVFFGFIKYDFKKFFILNSLMIFYSLATFFATIFIGFSIFEYFFKEYSLYLFIILIIIFVFPHIYKKVKN
ncbi:MAG: VTT domain-containing protein [Candidatus Gracilibacteria bacterium]|nr:VTT domain-containing protein [Candidatus Gracilibacteria bacterium]